MTLMLMLPKPAAQIHYFKIVANCFTPCVQHASFLTQATFVCVFSRLPNAARKLRAKRVCGDN
jgi:hypothetical protein